MIIQYKNQLDIYALICIIPKYHIEKNDMKYPVVYRSLKEVCQANSQNGIINKPKTVFFIVNNPLQARRTNIKQKRKQKKLSMDDYNENREFSCKNFNEKDALINIRNNEKQINKENYLKIYNYDNENGCRKKNDDNINNKNNKSCSASITHGEGYNNDCVVQIQIKRNNIHGFKEPNQTDLNPQTRTDGNNQHNQSLFATYNQYPLHINNHNKTSDIISKEVVRHIAPGEGGEVERKDHVNSEARPTFVADDLVNNYTQNKCKIYDELVNERPKENDITLLKIQTTDSQPLTTIVDTQGIAAVTKQNIPQYLSQRHIVNDLEEEILHGQQINVNNLLDVAGNLCAGPIGALCDMAAFSKLDFSPLGDLKDQTTNNQEFLAKKYYHPLYAHGVCRWPGCELPLDDMATFVKFFVAPKALRAWQKHYVCIFALAVVGKTKLCGGNIITHVVFAGFLIPSYIYCY